MYRHVLGRALLDRNPIVAEDINALAMAKFECREVIVAGRQSEGYFELALKEPERP